MQTNIHPELQPIPMVAEAESILRSCVHCGFCTAVCPTYQQLGDELDGPRGRIYLIKEMLEQDSVADDTHQHLDRCLSCRSCETTCPSGVEYGRLLDVGRGLLNDRYHVKRPLSWRLKSWGLRFLLPKPRLFAGLYHIGLLFRPLLPIALKEKMPVTTLATLDPAPAKSSDINSTDNTVLLLEGCVQRSMTPGVNRAIEQLCAVEKMNIVYLKQEGCCGAVDYHLGHHVDGLGRMKQLVDKIHSQLEGVKWVVSSASGCGVTIKDYPHLLKDDPDYSVKAQEVVAKVRDISEIIDGQAHTCEAINVAVHTPCTLQHGQKSPDAIAEILSAAGAHVVPVADSHLCCGSAGTYSVLEPQLSRTLGEQKLSALTQEAPDIIVTANVGCQTQLASISQSKDSDDASGVPVMHWAEFLAHYPAAKTHAETRSNH